MRPPRLAAPPPPPPAGRAPARAVQRSAERVFAPQARLQRPPPPRGVVAEELVPGPGGQFQLRAPERQTLAPPSGTFNFVRVEGEAPRSRPVLMSSRLPHAQIAAGRPVVYAGTARFERGAMVWWSNYSGTYQPMADFRAQAGLPEEKFVPWQRLQMGGVAMQRGTFGERRVAETPTAPARPDAVDAKAKGTAGGTGQGGKQGAGTGGRGDAKP